LSGGIDAATEAIALPDARARDDARALQARLTKPAGALGRLEDLHAWAAAVYGRAAPSIERRIIVVAAADHGVASEGVSAYPADVTAQMVRNFLAEGAAINVLARRAGADVHVVDAGVASDVDDPRLYVAKLRGGTANMCDGPAMRRDEAIEMVERGVSFARELCSERPSALALGDMGIGNTTAAAAITAVIAGAPARAVAGRGTGIDDDGLARKVDIIERSIAQNRPDAVDPIDVLAKVGGFEIAFLAGVALGGAAERAAVLADGYPTTAAALVAGALAPASIGYMLASHMSAEPGHHIALAHLGLDPLLDFGMRLGEGTGAALALSVLDAALAIPREMATFDSAGVSRGTHDTLDER
jgi:nicotinate-nucleotide--dimethylbenzimidazole phosphoribosyltransferase